MSSDEIFYKRLDKIKAFESDLKAIFKKHNITLKDDVDMWHGGSKDVIRIIIDNEVWNNCNFIELLNESKIIE